MTQVRQSITKGDYDVENVSKIKYIILLCMKQHN